MNKKSKRRFRIEIDQTWPVYDSEPEMKERILAGIFHGLLLGVWSVGWIGWICGNAGLKPEVIKLAGIAVICGILIELLNLMYLENKALIFGSVILAVIAKFNQTSVLSGYNAWAEGLEKAISRYYQMDIHLVVDNVDIAENMLFYGLLLVFLMLLINFATASIRSNWITSLLTGLALAMSLMLDVFPDIWWMFAVIIALGGLIAFDSVNVYVLNAMMNRKTLRAGALAVVMLTLILGLSDWLARNYAADFMHQQYAAVKDYPQQMFSTAQRVLGQIMGDPPGTLSNRSPVQSDSVELKIWTDVKPQSAVYMKDFVGASYDTGTERWAVITDDGLRKDYQSWSASGQWNYDEAKALWAQQLYRCLGTIEDGAPEQNYIVSNISADDQCTWVPYGINVSGMTMEGDSYLKASSQSEFSGYPLPDLEKMLTDKLGSTVLEQEEADLFRDYDSYVYANYLSVPEGMSSLEQAVEALQTENGDMAAYQWVKEIQNCLWQNCTYEKNNLEPVPDGSNVVEDFFGRQKKGYCVHFASAGVMMLRLAGIPARYASGYVVWPQDFKKDAASGGYTADVTGYRGHAWIEIYDWIYGIWIPVDMTPSDDAIAQNHPSAIETDAVNTENLDSTDSLQETASETTETVTEATETASETSEKGQETEGESSESARRTEGTGDSTNTLNNSQTSTGKDKIIPVWPVLIIAALVVLGGFICYFGRRKRPSKAYSRVNRNKALLSRWQHLTEELERSGIRPDRTLDDWSYIEWLQSQLEQPDEKELTWLMEKLHQAAFSEDMLTKEEYAQCIRICHEIKNNLEKRK